MIHVIHIEHELFRIRPALLVRYFACLGLFMSLDFARLIRAYLYRMELGRVYLSAIALYLVLETIGIGGAVPLLRATAGTR